MDESSSANLVSGRNGRQELRASLLKPYLLRLRESKGQAHLHELMATARFPLSALGDETTWVSVAEANRMLVLIEEELGEDTLTNLGPWFEHPENLGTYVRMLRTAAVPLDIYRYLAQHPEQAGLIGFFQLLELSPVSLRMTYNLSDDSQSLHRDRVFCDARVGELGAIPRFWGKDDAEVVHETCLARGDRTCTYVITWKRTPTRGTSLALASVLALVSGAIVGVIGGGLMSIAIGIAFGGAAAVFDQVRRDNAARIFSRHRIAALERGLTLRGESATTQGDLRGTVLSGKYRLGRLIGTGGFGIVYAAEHIALGSTVAVKILRDAVARDGGEVARLRREAQVQVAIEHPNVVRTLDLDQLPDGSIYVVMELLRGMSLAQKLAMDELVPVAIAVPLFIQICRALDAAHNKGIVHRDLKPANVFLCDGGTVKVLDFGMSKLANVEPLTGSGYILGTPEYMAPEQSSGSGIDARTDLYAFGILMYRSLTGILPLEAPTRNELLAMHRRTIPPTLRERRPDLDIPVSVEQIIMKTLSKGKDERPSSAREIETALARARFDRVPSG
jgi:serine/threonine-protein kinase